MSGVRVLVGTRKGAFVLTSDGARKEWDVSGPHFPGWEVYHVAGSPADPDRLYAAPSGGWFGQVIQRSDDGGLTWEPKGSKLLYEGEVGPHQWYDGTPRPWAFTRVWHLEPSLTDPDTVYAGVEDAALFRSVDGAPDLAGASRAAPAQHQRGLGSRARAACACTRSSWIPSDPARMYAGISAAGAFRSDDAGEIVAADQPGPQVRGHPGPRRPRSATACITSPCTPPGRRCCSCRSTGTSCAATTPASRGTRSAATCRPTSASRSPSTRNEPDTIYVVPITSDSHHFVMDGKLRVYRSRTGGNEWEALTDGTAAAALLRQRAARRDGRRLARRLRHLLRHLRRAGVRVGGRRRHLGRRSFATCRPCCRSKFRRCR